MDSGTRLLGHESRFRARELHDLEQAVLDLFVAQCALT